MNFKRLGLGLAATAAMTTGIALTEAPAQALSFGDALDFSSKSGSLASFNETTGFLDFGLVENDFASPFGSLNEEIFFNDITLTSIAPVAPGAIASWQYTGATPFTLITGLDDGLGGETRVYDVVSFVLNQYGPNAFIANVNGFFNPPGVQGVGGISSFGSFTLSGSTISGQITVVPTPALLPGLIGMGLAAMRKRKNEQVEHSETVKA